MVKLVRFHVLASTLFGIVCCILHLFVGSYGVFPWLNLLAFSIPCATALVHPLLSVGVLTFSAPFLANVPEQIQALFYLDIFTLDLLSIDAVVGCLAGLLCLEAFSKKWRFRPNSLPDKTGILSYLLLGFHLLIIGTVAIAISRNLYQAASPFSIQGLIYNLTNLRILGWYDDYFPLKDLFVFTAVIALSVRFLALIRTKSELVRGVLVPLFTTTAIILAYALFSKITGIGFHRSGVEQGVNSFLPDIHAYGGYALAAFLGSLYYLNSPQPWVKRVALAFSLLAAIGVVVSGSRFALVVLFLAFFIYVGFLVAKQPKKHLPVLACLTLTAVAAALLLHHWGDRGLLSTLARVPNAKSFAEINVALSYRPEIFRSTLLMYSHYPILGLGKGSFYRQSSISEFSNSEFFTVLNRGENAHNYFLQLLAETGIVGLSLFCLIFIYQGLVLRNRHNQIVTVLILGIFSGNLYGHSLLLPNILVLLFILLGSTNTGVQDGPTPLKLWPPAQIPKFRRWFLVAAATFSIVGAIAEVSASYGKIPFQQQFFCYKHAYHADQQTGGLFEQAYPIAGNRLKLSYTIPYPDLQERPLTIHFHLEPESQRSLSRDRVINAPGHYEEVFDISGLRAGENVLVQIKTSRCLTPVNLGMNSDTRRLGIVLTGVVQE